MSTLIASPALSAYDALAPTYDRFTEAYDHEGWLGRLEELALTAGLRGRRVLDVGCGTGKSARPLLERGYEVRACDISPGMVAIARRRLGPRAEVVVADMRDLPAALGPVDLVTCLDDAINYLAGEDDLLAAFGSARRLLAPGGLYVFDVNTLAAYDQAYCAHFVVETGDTLFCWRGERPTAVVDGAAFRSTLDAFAREPDGRWERTASVHEQHHFGDATIRRLLGAAGLEVVAVHGQTRSAHIDPSCDEHGHYKRLTIARRPE